MSQSEVTLEMVDAALKAFWGAPGRRVWRHGPVGHAEYETKPWTDRQRTAMWKALEAALAAREVASS